MKTPWMTPSILKGVLAGDRCQYGPWFRANHYRYRKVASDFDSEAWRRTHDPHVERLAREFTANGWSVRTEEGFSVRGTVATVKCRPDVVAIPDDDSSAVVIDVKTGRPREADRWQVRIYLALLPLADSGVSDRGVVGELHYPDEPNHDKPNGYRVDRVTLAHDEADYIWDQIKRLADSTAPPATPSVRECRFCDIADCQDRAAEDEVVASAGGMF